jgi:hypothetical protein
LLIRVRDLDLSSADRALRSCPPTCETQA